MIADLTRPGAQPRRLDSFCGLKGEKMFRFPLQWERGTRRGRCKEPAAGRARARAHPGRTKGGRTCGGAGPGGGRAPGSRGSSAARTAARAAAEMARSGGAGRPLSHGAAGRRRNRFPVGSGQGGRGGGRRTPAGGSARGAGVAVEGGSRSHLGAGGAGAAAGGLHAGPTGCHGDRPPARGGDRGPAPEVPRAVPPPG